jgi:hypothetical protein
MSLLVKWTKYIIEDVNETNLHRTSLPTSGLLAHVVEFIAYRRELAP